MIVAFAAYAATLAVMATAGGIGVTPDSTVYLAVAANLRDGLGLVGPSWDGRIVPLSHYPPLFPAILAALASTGLSLEAAARFVNPLLFGVTVVLTAKAAGGVRGPLRAEAALAAGVVATSLDLLTVHTMAWSEPLFLAFGLAGFTLLGSSLDRNGRGRVVVAAAFVAAASLVRFPGVALILGGVAVLLARAEHPWARRFVDAAMFGAIAAGPLALLFARNAIATGHAANRPIAIHLLLEWRARTALVAFSSWMTPGASCCLDNAVIVLVGGLALIAIAVAVGRFVWRSGGPQAAWQDVPTRLATAFVAAYLFVATADMIFLDASQYYGDRLITPLFIAAVIFVCSQMRRANALPRAALAASIVLMAFGAVAQTRYTRDARTHSLGYGRDVWERSPTIGALRSLPPEMLVVTNRPDAVRYLAGRPARGLPLRRGIQSHLPNETYATELDRLAADVEAGQTVVAWFTADPPAEGVMVSPQELNARLGLGMRLADGLLYGRMPAR